MRIDEASGLLDRRLPFVKDPSKKLPYMWQALIDFDLDWYIGEGRFA